MTDIASDIATNINPEMAAAAGAVMSRKTSYPVSASDIRRWAIAVYHPGQPPARFLTAESDADLQAPEEFNPFAWIVASSESSEDGSIEANDPDRTEKSLGITPPGLKFQLNGGMEVEYGAPLRVGDVITSESTLAGYTERSGRLGLMLITTFADTWTNQNGEHVKTSRTTLIRY